MEESRVTETPGNNKKEALSREALLPPPPPPPRNRKRPAKIFVAAILGLVFLIGVIIYYDLYVAPYESTDDAFIDGYITLLSSRVPGQVSKLLVSDNQYVKE